MKKVIKYSVIIFVTLTLAVLLFSIFYINNIMKDYSNITFDKTKIIAESGKITLLDVANDIVETNSAFAQQKVDIEECPSFVTNAFISIEDKRFFTHHGLDYKRITKAMYNNITSGTIKEGASTISQQLIKNTHLNNDRTLSRKIKEIMLTKKLEKELSKKDILDAYINVIYFGEGSYGIESASKNYFGVKTSDLSIAQAATLAGIIKSPAKYSPKYNKQNCLERRNLVLKQMLTNNFITQSQYSDAKNEELIIIENEQNVEPYNLYLKAVLHEASDILNLSEKDTASKGFIIKTYLDKNAQNTLEQIICNNDYYHTNSHGNVADSLATIIDNKTNGIKAYTGKSKYNLVSFTRQPGSAIKPILVYAPALVEGLVQPATLVLDEPIDYSGYSPHNVGGEFHGYVSIKESISKSLNIPAIKVLDYVGIEKAKTFAQKANIAFSDTDNGLAIALGGFTQGITLNNLTNSFTIFANNGYYKNATFIKEITDSRGNVVYKHTDNKAKIIGEDTAFLMNYMLTDGVQNGTSKKLKTLPYQVAGKTGTVSLKNSNNNSDAYSIAYTTSDTMGVWLGNYSNQKEHELESKNNGGTYATEIIKQTFLKIYEKNKPSDFMQPTNVQEVVYDAIIYDEDHTIKLADDNTPERYTKKDYFSTRYLPKEQSTKFNKLQANNFNVNYTEDKAIITFDIKTYFKYELYKVYNNDHILLSTYEDKNDAIVYEDSDLKPNTKYSYYVKVINPYNSSYNNNDSIIILTNSNTETLKQEFNLATDKFKIVKNKKNSTDSLWYFNTI